MEVVQVTAVADKFHPSGVASDNARYVSACIRYILSRSSTPAVPGRQEAPESANKSRRFSGCPGLPGTVGRLGRLGGMSRIKGEAYMAALYGAIRLEGLLFGRRQRELFMPRARSYPAPTVIIL